MRDDIELALFEQKFRVYSPDTQVLLLDARGRMTPYEIARQKKLMNADARHGRILRALDVFGIRTPWRVLREAAVIPERFSVVDNKALTRASLIAEGTCRSDLYVSDLEQTVAEHTSQSVAARAILEIAGVADPNNSLGVENQFVQTYLITQSGKELLTRSN